MTHDCCFFRFLRRTRGPAFDRSINFAFVVSCLLIGKETKTGQNRPFKSPQNLQTFLSNILVTEDPLDFLAKYFSRDFSQLCLAGSSIKTSFINQSVVLRVVIFYYFYLFLFCTVFVRMINLYSSFVLLTFCLFVIVVDIVVKEMDHCSLYEMNTLKKFIYYRYQRGEAIHIMI